MTNIESNILMHKMNEIICCFSAWEKDVRVIGNIRAGDAVIVLEYAFKCMSAVNNVRTESVDVAKIESPLNALSPNIQ